MQIDINIILKIYNFSKHEIYEDFPGIKCLRLHLQCRGAGLILIGEPENQNINNRSIIATNSMKIKKIYILKRNS